MKFLLLVLSFSLFALDIDEKLTLRILKVSDSKKTVLINRGVEDGLKVGDHAKFYLTDGMIARGLVVKTSPSRSVWSLYRMINPDEIMKEKVVNLKIASPVKITTDPSKMIIVEPVMIPGEDVPLDGTYSGKVQVNLSDDELRDLEAIKGDESFDDIDLDSPKKSSTRSKVYY